MVSNAGVLKAGGLEEMEPDQFNKTTTSITTVIFIAQNTPQR